MTDTPVPEPTVAEPAAARTASDADATSTDAADVISTDAASTDATSTDATLGGADERDADEGGAAEVQDAAPADAEPPPPTPYATFVPVEVVSVAFELPGPSPTIHLRERDSPYRGIDFPIGLPEAQSIAAALEGTSPPRPATHDLMAAVLAATGCDVVAVRVTGAREGTLLAELDLMGPRGREVLDCRPTDGIAVALRLAVPAPILCDADLLD